MIKGYEDFIARHRPAGYVLHRRKMKNHDGLATFQRTITISKDLEDTEAIFVLLHEFGHVHFRHLHKKHSPNIPEWRAEYEADQYAIAAMKDAGIPVPRSVLSWHKEIVRDLLAEYGGDEEPSEALLKYAYGKGWKAHA